MEGWLWRNLMLAIAEFYLTERRRPVKFISSWWSVKCWRNANDQIFVKSACQDNVDSQSKFGETGPYTDTSKRNQIRKFILCTLKLVGSWLHWPYIIINWEVEQMSETRNFNWQTKHRLGVHSTSSVHSLQEEIMRKMICGKVLKKRRNCGWWKLWW